MIIDIRNSEEKKREKDNGLENTFDSKQVVWADVVKINAYKKT